MEYDRVEDMNPLENQGCAWLMENGYIDDYYECPVCNKEQPICEDVIDGQDVVCCEKCNHRYDKTFKEMFGYGA